MRILLVDDEIAILRYEGTYLCSLGHNVFTFTGCSNRDALDICELASDVRFEVAILDIMMPGINGMDLAELIHRVSPSTEFIVSSAGADLCATAVEHLEAKGLSVQSLTVPFEPEELKSRLARFIVSNSQPIKLHNEGGENRMKMEVHRAVQRAMCDFSSIGMPCNEFAPHCKRISDFIWRDFPRLTEKAAVSRLKDLLSQTFSVYSKTSPPPAMASAIFSLLPPLFKGEAFQVIRSIRSYPRHCSWCSREIAKGREALVVYGAKNRRVRPRFCSDDCYQNWESNYWQRVALRRSELPEKELVEEKKRLNRKTRFPSQ